MRVSGYILRSVLILSVLSASSGRAQLSPGPAVHSDSPPLTVPDRFAKEPFVIISRSSVIAMNADGTGYEDNTLVVRIQSELALKQFGIVFLSFGSSFSHVELQYVRVHRPDGTVIETPIADAIIQPAAVTRQAPFYSDLKELQLPIRSLRVGDTIDWKARTIYTSSETPGNFFGQESFVSNGVTLSETVDLRVPAETRLIYWTNPDTANEPVDSTDDHLHILRWSHSNLKPTVGEEAVDAKTSKEARLLTPEQELDAEKGVLPSISWSTFAGWKALSAWYRMVESDRTAADSTIRAKVAEITAGKSTQEEKAQAIYTYVSTQVRYIGVAFGIGRYQPHTAAEVLSNQYGDCKDKHTLFASMLSVIGLHADAVLIGDGIRFNPRVPSPASFNHVITRVSINGQKLWLDTTTGVAPWRVLVPRLRDQQALLVPDAPDPDPAVSLIVTTPPYLPFDAFSNLTAIGSLDKNMAADSRITMTFRGDAELDLRALLSQTSPAQYNEFAQRLMQAMGYGGTTTEPEFGSIDDTSLPLTFSFHYHRIKEADWGKDRITTPLMAVMLPFIDDKKPPTASIQLGSPRSETSSVTFALPQGWGADLPRDIHAYADFATCDVTFRMSDGKLRVDRRVVIFHDKLPATDWKRYQAWYTAAQISGTPFIKLKH